MAIFILYLSTSLIYLLFTLCFKIYSCLKNSQGFVLLFMSCFRYKRKKAKFIYCVYNETPQADLKSKKKKKAWETKHTKQNISSSKQEETQLTCAHQKFYLNCTTAQRHRGQVLWETQTKSGSFLQLPKSQHYLHSRSWLLSNFCSISKPLKHWWK